MKQGDLSGVSSEVRKHHLWNDTFSKVGSFVNVTDGGWASEIQSTSMLKTVVYPAW